MDIQTTRFGTVAIEAEDVLHFPTGLVGLEDCQHWVLLADAQNDALGWLQSTARPEVALAVVTPRRFVPDYQVRIVRSELAPLAICRPQDAKVLVIVGKNDRAITLNLKAPLVLNLDSRLGRQVVANNEYPVQHELSHETPLKKKIA
jgi:flagellar assembly factor FliW